jgi:hypothetical protein
MNPTDAYYKTKRALLLFVGGLLLAIFAGFKIVNGEQRISFMPFQLERPELLSTILFVVVAFYLFQLSLQWAAQQAEVQENKFHRIDFISTVAIGALAALCYFGSLAIPFSRTLNISLDVSALFVFAIGFIAVIAVTIYGSIRAEKLAAWFGKFVKGEVAKNEDALLTTLLSAKWILNFNPKNPNGKKSIVFNGDGTISEGQNKNESTWRIRNGLLEIMNSQGQVFSRFVYQPEKDIFEHTNDLDTLSIKSQTIARQSDISARRAV